MKIKSVIISIVIIVTICIAYYLVSPFFIKVHIDEPLPQNNEITVIDGTIQQNSEPVTVIGSAGHPASGTVKIVKSGSKTYLRYENFKTINGPDIYVYLAKDLGAKEYINLGKVKATEGNINYEIPYGVDPKEYPYAMTWCKAFSVLFNYAKLY